jgi:hypothetical protein
MMKGRRRLRAFIIACPATPDKAEQEKQRKHSLSPWERAGAAKREPDRAKPQ